MCIDPPAGGLRGRNHHADCVCAGQQHGAGGQLADAIRVPMPDHTPAMESAARAGGDGHGGLLDLVGVTEGSRRGLHIRDLRQWRLL